MNNNRQELKKQVKKHIPKDWLCELRIAHRILMEAINDIKSTGIVNLVIITTMAAILTLFGVLFRFTLSLSTFAGELGNVLEISVYLKPNAQVSVVKDRVKDIKHVKNVKLISKDDSWNSLRKELALPTDMGNPLPDTLRVRVDKPDNITEVFSNIKSLAGVEDMGYAKELAKKIQLLTHVVNTTMVFVIIVSAALTITIINNTIQLVIQSRKDEIEIMRLMGVSNWYIKTPLIMQGAFYGFVASIIAVLPLSWVQGLLINVHKFFLIPMPAYAQNIVIITLLLIGTAFGASGSFLSIKKHLQV
ncbi:permease-like cell division protein FtsX [bacterium]|nr:permease-like cell division protein FtsX [bacterium]